MRDELLRIIGHELRGALAPLGGWVKVLRRADCSPEDTARAVDVIDRSLQTLTRLAADLTALSEMRTRDLRVARTPVDLREVVVATTRLVTPEAAAKGVALEARVPAEPVAIVGDAVRLTQIVGNLVGNAVKFTERGGEVLVKVVAAPDSAQVVVDDSGVGIGPEFLPHVFDKFAREMPGDGSHAGTGLGLHVVKRLVALHQGTIEAYSAGPGCGSRFVVTLPLAHTAAA